MQLVSYMIMMQTFHWVVSYSADQWIQYSAVYPPTYAYVLQTVLSFEHFPPITDMK
jgi:hypothetical protein